MAREVEETVAVTGRATMVGRMVGDTVEAKAGAEKAEA